MFRILLAIIIILIFSIPKVCVEFELLQTSYCHCSRVNICIFSDHVHVDSKLSTNGEVEHETTTRQI